jgi:hypothetical protein
MKLLDINSPAGQVVASTVLFERLQEMFHLHPSSMVGEFKRIAEERGCSALSLVPAYHLKTQRLFAECFTIVVLILKGQTIPPMERPPKETADMIDYFGLSPAVLAKNIKDKSLAVNHDAVKIAEFTQAEIRNVILWAFAQVQLALEKEERGQG